MEGFIAAFWDLKSWFALSLGVFIGLILAALLMMSRRSEPDGPPTITIPPVEEPMGEQVDVRSVLRRYE